MLGTHYCLGAPLSRLEAELALTRFAQRVVGPERDGEPPRHRPHVVLRGPVSLPLRTAGILDRTTPWDAAPDPPETLAAHGTTGRTTPGRIRRHG
ncbi:hypothetical protein [Streptomyces sp. NPDC001165]|uniref:hypothetical protein n=1 Tax=Streptomyces sp. NPDC001165 TaxID=3364546 RepID=UPI00367379C3